MILNIRNQFLFFSAVLLVLSTCEEGPSLEKPFKKQTPREAYVQALEDSGLGDTRMVEAWQQAGRSALEDSTFINGPFRETGHFRAEAPEAAAFRFELQAGERMQIRLDRKPSTVKLFVDLFRIELTDSTANYQPALSTDASSLDSLSYEPEDPGRFVLRLQPELLADCRYTIELLQQPAYGFFPVSSKGNTDIWSFFGDPRDAGRRRHEGIDIFARRGTPVVAVTEGIVRTRNRGLGGKQVWLRDQRRRQSIYYAHLDSQLVETGAIVRPGDTIGWVGNTGNAAGTSPHLHFGIYRWNYGAVDPQPYVARLPDELPELRADTSLLGQLGRILVSPARLQSAPAFQAETRQVLSRHLPLRIEAASGRWYRVRLPDGEMGYVAANQIETADRPLRQLAIDSTREMLIEPLPAAMPLTTLGSDTSVEVLGQAGDFQLVRAPDGLTGWLLRD